MAASLLFCIGPLTILGSLYDGLGNGADQLFLKATLDGFAAIAFAASFGWGVGASVVVGVVVQGTLTVLGAAARQRAPRRPPRGPDRDRRPAAGRGRPAAAADQRGPGRRPAAGAAGGSACCSAVVARPLSGRTASAHASRCAGRWRSRECAES